jgi:hypothetical protein
MHHDGAGSYLLCAPSGGKSWIFHYIRDKRTREMGLGPFPTFSLDEARERANRQRQLLADDLDPIEVRHQQKQDRVVELVRRTTFADAAAEFIEAKSPGWKNPKHAWQWGQTVSARVYPKIGTLPVADVGTDQVMAVLRPIW